MMRHKEKGDIINFYQKKKKSARSKLIHVLINFGKKESINFI